MTRLGIAVVMATAVASIVPAVVAAQGRDYDVQNGDWNGLQELVRIAQTSDVELRPVSTLEWTDVRRGDGLLVLYPLSRIDLDDLSGFLNDGGRLALFDDFGNAGPLFQWFQVSRDENVHGTPRSPRMPGLLVAYRHESEHQLADGVDTLVTNEPVGVWHPRLQPVFALSDDPHSGIVLAGAVNRGRLVVGGDPSVLINTMMRFPGNRQFAHNLLVYLAGRPGGRVWLVHSGFRVSGMYRGRRSREGYREVIQNVDEALERLSTLGASSTAVRVLGVLLALGVAFSLARVIWGPQPTDRFGPSGPSGAAAGVTDKIAIFSLPRANMLYPSLIAKRYLERGLLRAVGLRPPTDVGAVVARAKGRLSREQENELRSLLIDLDQLGTPADEGGPSRISPARFVSLWRRIGAILTALGDA